MNRAEFTQQAYLVAMGGTDHNHALIKDYLDKAAIAATKWHAEHFTEDGEWKVIR